MTDHGGDRYDGEVGDVVAVLALTDFQPLAPHVRAQEVSDLLAVDL